MVSGLTDAISQVKTHGGLTPRFALQSSVRQGDPLAPIVYCLITDALHEGLRNNPLFPRSARQGGYTFVHPDPDGTPVRVCSSGYADDTVLLSTDPVILSQMHEWVRAFFGAHSFTLNCKKTKFLCSSVRLAPRLASVNGEKEILPLKGSTFVRYLGVWINLDLAWHGPKSQRSKLEWAVNCTCLNIRRHKFNLFQSITAVQQYLYPCMRLGLLFANVPKTTRIAWDTKIRQAIFHGAGMTQGNKSLKKAAFYVTTRLPRLQDLAATIKGEDLLVTLNAQYPSSTTCWSRLGPAGISPLPGPEPEGHGPVAAPQARPRQRQTVADLADRAQFVYTHDPTHVLPATATLPLCTRGHPETWRPRRSPWLHSQTEHGGVYCGLSEVTAYTDGSTGEHPGRPSGCAAVICTGGAESKVLQQLSFPFAASGNNYASEVMAILGALVQTPENVNITIHTDSLSSIGGANKGRGWDWARGRRTKRFALPQRARIVQSCRAGMKCIRGMISQRSGTTTLRHVKAHSGKTDIHSLMNELADRLANQAREEAIGDPDAAVRTLFGQEKVGLVVAGVDVTGSFRNAMSREANEKQLLDLQTVVLSPAEVAAGEAGPDSHRMSLVARRNGARVVSWCDAARSSKSSNILMFTMEYLATWLPTEASLAVVHNRTANRARGSVCKLCNNAEETVAHALASCPEEAIHATRAASVRIATGLILKTASALLPLQGSNRSDSVRIKAWFDPTGETILEVCGQIPPAVLEGISNHNAVDGFVGINPPNIDKLLQWTRTNGMWERSDLSTAQDRKTRMQATLLRGAYCVWATRCQQMDQWWASPAASKARNDHADCAVAAAAARPAKTNKRQASRHAKAHPVVPGSKDRVAPNKSDSGCNTQATVTRTPTGRLPYSLSRLNPSNSTGQRETADKGLHSLRTKNLVRAPDPGPFLTDDAQTASIIGANTRDDEVRWSRKGGRWTAKLPWF